MRAPFKGNDYFGQAVNAVAQKVEQTYLEAIRPAIAMRKVSAMLSDGTVTQTDTFDPRIVEAFYQSLANLLKSWTFSGIMKSLTEDLQRLYCQFTKEVDKYYISGYFGVQFHVLPYYKVDKRVIEIQRELAKIADDATAVFRNMTGATDMALADELGKRGYANLEFQELFAKMFNDEKLAQELDEKASAIESLFPDFKEMGMRKTILFEELNNLLIELYQTSPVLLDNNKLMQGEEGVSNYFDIEVMTNKKTKARKPNLDTPKIRRNVTDIIAAELECVENTLKKAASS